MNVIISSSLAYGHPEWRINDGTGAVYFEDAWSTHFYNGGYLRYALRALHFLRRGFWCLLHMIVHCFL